MRKVVLILAIIMFTNVCNAQKAHPFLKNDKYGIILGDKVLVKPKYQDLQALGSGLYASKLKEQYGVINERGDIVIPMVYDNIKLFGDGIYLVEKNAKLGLVNRFNSVVLPIEYSDIHFINDFLCQVSYQGKCGLVSKYGTLVVAPEYDVINTFTPSTFLIKKNNKEGIMDNSGNVIVPIEYDNFEKQVDSDSYNVKKGNKVGLLNSSWQLVIPADYDSIENSIVGKNLLLDGKIGFYTESGKLVKPSFSRILFSQPEFGLIVFANGEKRGFVTSQGVIVEPAYENMSRFSGKGIAFVEKEGKLMAVNVMGKEMTVQETMSNMPGPPSDK